MRLCSEIQNLDSIVSKLIITLIWKQWDSNLVSNVTGNHIHVHAVIIVYKESPLMRYMCICTCISLNPQSTTVNYYTNYYKGCGSS